MDFTEAYTAACSSVGMAARTGCADQLLQMIEQGRVVDVADNRGWRPTHEAAYHGHVNCLKLLLEQESTDVNWKSFERKTALFLAAQQNQKDCVVALIQAGADVNLRDEMDVTPVLAAVMEQNDECMKMLLEAGADVNIQPYNGRSPLHQAAVIGCAATVQTLLDHDAQLNLLEDHEISPIFIASQYGNHECLKVLIAAAVEKGQQDLVNKPAVDGATPLFLASQEGHSNCVHVLLQNGADANLAIDSPEALPLHAAVEFDRIDCIKQLVPVTDLSDWTRFHPLITACMKKDPTSLKCLVDCGLDINVKLDLQDVVRIAPFFLSTGLKFSPHGTPLALVAACKARIEFAEILIAAGADVNACFRHSIPPVLAAAYNQHSNLVKLLVSRGASVNFYHSQIIPNLAVVMSMLEFSGIEQILRLGAEAESCFSFRSEHFRNSFQKKPFLESHKDCEQCSKKERRVLQSPVTLADILTDTRLHFGSRGYFTIMLLLQFVGSVSLDPNLKRYVRTEKQWKALSRLTGSPRSLGHLCRMSVRSAITPRQLTADQWAQDLPVPNIVKDYLLYKTLDDEIITCGTIQ